MTLWFLELWVAALRSGEYLQGNCFLRNDNDTYCCLGVACDLLVKRGVLEEWYWNEEDETWWIEEECTMLPALAADYIGINKWGELPDGLDIGVESSYLTLVDLNDNLHYSFEEIARVLELVKEHLEIGT